MTSITTHQPISIVLQERDERKDGKIRKVSLLKMNEFLLKMKNWRLNECQLISIKTGTKKARNGGAKKHEGGTATFFTDDMLGY